MSEFKLHCFAQSGNAYKVALMLNVCGADWEPVFVDFFNGQTRDPEWRARVNEMGEAPVLEHGPQKLAQSGIILDYLAEHFDRFMPKDPSGRRDVWRWILWDNHKFTSFHAANRFIRNLQDQGETPVTAFLAGRAEGARSILEAHLSKNDWVSGNEPSIADFSIAGYMFYPETELSISFKDIPSIEAWRNRIRALPGFVEPYDLMPEKG